MSFWDSVNARIAETTGTAFSSFSQRSVHGGSINSSYVIKDEKRHFFVKRNVATKLDMFEAEVEGLLEISDADVIKVPKPICSGVGGDSAYVVLEYIALGPGNRSSAEKLGQSLAAMHQVTHGCFGWRRDNTIGFTPQINDYAPDWITFWTDHRLKFQLELAARNGYNGRLRDKLQRLCMECQKLFNSYSPVPSLLHGDLWGGNYAADEQGNPVIFDPAVYYGDRETDIAMTELFGGFSPRFYQAYNEVFPLDDGYPIRKTLYNLYHILNHLNLFGGGYLSQAEHMAEKVLSEIL